MNSPGTARPTVLLLISSEGYFGVENMLVNLAVALNKLGCRCVVAVFCDARFRHTEVGDWARARGLTVEIVPCSGRFDWRAIAHIRSLLDEHRVDVLHTHGYKADLYGYAAAWPQRVALIATCHNWPHPAWSMRAYAALDRLFLRRFDRVVVLSEAVTEILKHSGIPSSKLETISNGVDLERFRDPHPTLKTEIALPNEVLVGFVGRLVPGKGGDVLLRAAQQVLRVRSNTKFVLVGDGPCRKDWESLSSHLGIHEHIVFTGVREDMPGVYASLQLLVLPSLCEAMPMCVLEAMATGKPVIATRVGALPELVDPDKTGLLVEPADVEGLSAAIVQILNNPELAHRMGTTGQAQATERFSADSMAKQYLDLYQTVVNTRESSNNRRSIEYEFTA